jgi:hypothetical protein
VEVTNPLVDELDADLVNEEACLCTLDRI